MIFTGFNLCLKFSLPGGSVGKNVFNFGVDMSPSAYVNNKKKDVLILGKGPTQELNYTTLTAETRYSFNVSRSFIRDNCNTTNICIEIFQNC